MPETRIIADPLIELQALAKQLDECIKRAGGICNALANDQVRRMDEKVQLASMHCLNALQSARQLAARITEGPPPPKDKK